MPNTTTIRTTITKHNKDKLREYGKGVMSVGIENLIQIAESKSITITIITELVV